MAEAESVVWTARVGVRHTTEMDRERFVELFCDEGLMVFSDGALSREEADARFDRMLARCAGLTCAKQPIVERSTGVVVGYTGVDWIEFEEQRWLEWGYRLVPPARGNGYAIEASVALLNVAANEYSGEILGIIHLDNQASKNVVRKMGFKYWMQAPVQGEVRAVYRLRLGTDPHRGVSAGVVLAGQKRTQTSIGTPR